MLPNFLIIGSQKSGTTSLYAVLRRHPDIYMPETKEIGFFFHDELFRKGIGFYASYFEEAPLDKVAYGEASPGYICHPEAPKRIAQYLPNVKLIATVRNPIHRAYSQYWDNRRSLSESNTFDEAIDLYLSDSYEPGKTGYFSRGVYIKYIEAYLQHFNPEQLLVLVFEELLEDPAAFYRRIFRFLDVNEDIMPADVSRPFNASHIRTNAVYRFFFLNAPYQKYLPKRLRGRLFWGKKRKYDYPPMSDRAKKTLSEFYEPWNKQLSEYLGRDLSVWR